MGKCSNNLLCTATNLILRDHQNLTEYCAFKKECHHDAIVKRASITVCFVVNWKEKYEGILESEVLPKSFAQNSHVSCSNCHHFAAQDCKIVHDHLHLLCYRTFHRYIWIGIVFQRELF